MTWEGFYLLCFVVGFVLSVVAFLGGALHWPIGHHLHLPHFLSDAPAASHGAAGAHGAAGDSSVSPYNLATFMAFLAWFGGVGFLLTGRGHLGHLLVLFLAAAAGLAGAGIVFGFLTKVLLQHESSLSAADFEMVGVLGRVTVPIRAGGGTGEIVYSQAGTRRSAGARSESGAAIVRGSEVVVTRYDGGIAYVRLWEELAGGERGAPDQKSS
jgi:membrane protein implicated in regulation of membrane protease activity